MANRIMLNETSYHGAGAIAEIATEAKAHGFKKALVCSDPDLIKFNVTKKVTDILDKEGLDYEIYSKIANSHFLRTAGPHFPDSPGHIKRTAWDISRAEGTPPH